jgi:hypothetical protein
MKMDGERMPSNYRTCGKVFNTEGHLVSIKPLVVAAEGDVAM